MVTPPCPVRRELFSLNTPSQEGDLSSPYQSSLLTHSIYLLGGGVSMAALSVEHLKVRVYLLGGGLMVEPACASSDGGDGGDGGLNSRARNPSPYE